MFVHARCPGFRFAASKAGRALLKDAQETARTTCEELLNDFRGKHFNELSALLGQIAGMN